MIQVRVWGSGSVSDLIELGGDRGLVVGLQDPGLGLHDLSERPEADPVPVRQAPSLPPRDELGELIDVASELPDETRLAEPRLGDDRDELGRGTGPGSLEELGEHRQLEVPPDERSAVALLGPDPGDRVKRAPGWDRFGLALGRDRGELLVDDRLARSLGGSPPRRRPPSLERRPPGEPRCSSCPRSRTPHRSEDRRRGGRAPLRCSPRSGPRSRDRRLRCPR